ncbi:MAG: metal-dependent hydrolase [Dictyoglomus sp. NZ13-RE01]|nr:MAG: metal-dependent hydrolase [Dictyoglomus sp. NZ13-RE01]
MKQKEIDKEITKEKILELCNKWQNILKVKVNRIQIRKMKNKWGSCSSKGNLTLNKELTKLSLDCVEYVIVHELLHLIVPNHGRIFKTLLYTYLPDWEKIHNKLKNY